MPVGKIFTLPVSPNGSKYGLHHRGYVVGRTLGSGAYAKVKSAHAVKLNKKVAIKIIDKKTAPKDMLSKFLPREIETLRAAEHENVIKLHEVIETDDRAYLVLELAEGGDLLEFINARKHLSDQTARNLFKDLVSGIGKCHSMNIVHRDLKCENLLLDSQFRLKISDFGFARRHEGKHLETYCGSYSYAAPEVIMGDPYNGEASDIWSMGVILYAMVVGRLPFKDSNVKTLLTQLSTKLYFPTRISEDLKDLIRKMLAFSPKERLTISEIKKHPWMLKKNNEEGLTGKL